MRVRGLKLEQRQEMDTGDQIAPHAGARIETLIVAAVTPDISTIAPHAGARIETEIEHHHSEGVPIAPYAGARIETGRWCAERKQDWVPVPPESPGSHLMQECGKETRLGTRPAGVTRLLCRQKASMRVLSGECFFELFYLVQDIPADDFASLL